MTSNQSIEHTPHKPKHANLVNRQTLTLAGNPESGRENDTAYHPLANEDGFVLVAAIILLLILVILGVSSTTTTNIELQIAGNDKVHKQTFYQADGGLDLASELLEQNISCPQGFGTINLDTDGVDGTDYTYDADDDTAILGYDPAQLIKVTNRKFWQKTLAQATQASDGSRDFFSPANYDADAPHSNFSVGGDTLPGEGGSQQMAAGYEGVGKGSSGGGATILYDIYSQHLGMNNSQSLLLVQWRHIIGQEEDCRYAP